MYCQYFNLKKKPFQISSDNAFLWLGSKHAKALKLLKTGMDQNQGLMTLIGDIGTGKTTLTNEIIHTLDNKTIHAKIEDPDFELDQIYNVIAQALEFEQNNQEKFASTFYAFLKTAGSNKKKVVLIIDEAQRISQQFLKEIISWTKSGLNDVLTIILAGQLEFLDILNDNQNNLSLQKGDIKVQAFLEPLNEKETRAYIKNRLELAGTKHNIFLQTTIHEIYNYSKGIPRVINISCDQALIEAFAKNMKIIDIPTFQQAIAPLSLCDVQPEKQFLTKKSHSLENRPPQPQSPDKNSILKLSVCMAIIVCIFSIYLFYTWNLPHTMNNKLTYQSNNLSKKNVLQKSAARKNPDLQNIERIKQIPSTKQTMTPEFVEIKPVIQESTLGATVQPMEQDGEISILSESVDTTTDINQEEPKPKIILEQSLKDLYMHTVKLETPKTAENIEIPRPYSSALPDNKLEETSQPESSPDPDAIIDWLLER